MQQRFAELAKTTFVERPILAAVRHDECARQRIRSKPSSQRFAAQAVEDIIHTEFKAQSNCCRCSVSPWVNAYSFRHLRDCWNPVGFVG